MSTILSSLDKKDHKTSNEHLADIDALFRYKEMFARRNAFDLVGYLDEPQQNEVLLKFEEVFSKFVMSLSQKEQTELNKKITTWAKVPQVVEATADLGIWKNSYIPDTVI